MRKKEKIIKLEKRIEELETYVKWKNEFIKNVIERTGQDLYRIIMEQPFVVGGAPKIKKEE